MKMQGNPVSGGIGIGPVLTYRPVLPPVRERFVEKGQTEEERERYRSVIKELMSDLRALSSVKDPGGQMSIFETHAELLADPATMESVFDLIDGGICAEWAVHIAFQHFADLMRDSDNAIIRERSADFEDLRRKLLCRLSGTKQQDLSHLEAACILVAEELLPSDVAALDAPKVSAIVTERGGATSHAAILARSLGIPMLMQVENCTERLLPGETVIVDAREGFLIARPSATEQLLYTGKQREWLKERQEAINSRFQPARTQDGEDISLLLNVGGEVPVPDEVSACGGVGLLRSEFLFLERSSPPSEEEQFSHYRAVLAACGGKPVTLRTLDVGGDKTVPYLEMRQEENPFLGLRGVRLCLARPELFRTQLRAALRASAFGPLRMMFPMVGSIEEFEQAKRFVEAVKEELVREGMTFRRNMPLGVMIEVPALAMMGEELAEVVDFASIGTNDLCQYLNAADRMNDQVASYYDPCHPALWRLISSLAKAFSRAGKPLCICGEAAGNPVFLAAAYGLGVTSFSMGLASIGPTKRALRTYNAKKLRREAARLPKMTSATQIREQLAQFANGEPLGF